MATKLGLKKIATNIMFGVGGEGKVESPMFRADSMKVGDVTVKNIPLGTMDNPLLDLMMDGVLGPSLARGLRRYDRLSPESDRTVAESSDNGHSHSRLVLQRPADGACRRQRKVQRKFSD